MNEQVFKLSEKSIEEIIEEVAKRHRATLDRLAQ